MGIITLLLGVRVPCCVIRGIHFTPRVGYFPTILTMSLELYFLNSAYAEQKNNYIFHTQSKQAFSTWEDHSPGFGVHPQKTQCVNILFLIVILVISVGVFSSISKASSNTSSFFIDVGTPSTKLRIL